MDSLELHLQISRLADDIIADSGNAPKCLARAHAIKGLAEAVDEAEHNKVRKALNFMSFSEGQTAVAEFEGKQAPEAETPAAPAPKNKQAPAPKNK